MSGLEHRDLWSAGDYADVARLHDAPCRALVAAAAIGPGMAVLDIACGTGNTALAAARIGANVTGLDIVPRLLDVAQQRAAEEHIVVTWVEGDAEALEFEDGRFDAVVSSFGLGWAPNHERSAREAVRVLRPGGVLALCHWSADGFAGAGIQFLNELLPEAARARAWLWGDESHLKELFVPLGVQLSFERDTTPWTFGSVEEYVTYLEEKQPNAVLAKQHIGEPWAAIREVMRSRLEDINVATDGTWRVNVEYLTATGKKQA